MKKIRHQQIILLLFIKNNNITHNKNKILKLTFNKFNNNNNNNNKIIFLFKMTITITVITKA